MEYKMYYNNTQVNTPLPMPEIKSDMLNFAGYDSMTVAQNMADFIETHKKDILFICGDRESMTIGMSTLKMAILTYKDNILALGTYTLTKDGLIQDFTPNLGRLAMYNPYAGDGKRQF